MLLFVPMSPAFAQTATPAASAVSSPVATTAPAGPVTYGAGHKFCSEWSAAEVKADQSDYYANRFWVAGFMSAYNWYVSTDGFDIGRGLTPSDMKTFMHDRCAAHPTETVATAAAQLLTMLRTRQGR
ncbi:hypothetical protein [Sphingomonas sp. UYP23]